MPAPKVRADYEALKQVAQTFARQADATRESLQAIQRAKGVLESGDWVGQGATAFYREMNAAVLPAMIRLIAALESANQVSGQISQSMQQAEEDAARVFKVDQLATELAPGVQGGDATVASATVPHGPELGSLSKQYEVGKKGGPGAVSTGTGDAGGVSYGLYQFASRDPKTGQIGFTVAHFLGTSDGAPWADEFKGLEPGSTAFSQKWKEIAAREPEKFGEAQRAYIERTHYTPLANNLRNSIGLDAALRSVALQDVLWSTAVQHGVGGGQTVVKTALKGQDVSSLSDEQIIQAIYSERGRIDANGGLVHFKSSSKQVQQDVTNRFASELQEALSRLKHEQGVQ